MPSGSGLTRTHDTCSGPVRSLTALGKLSISQASVKSNKYVHPSLTALKFWHAQRLITTNCYEVAGLAELGGLQALRAQAISLT